jgi:hypothetical protein
MILKPKQNQVAKLVAFRILAVLMFLVSLIVIVT